jgi:tetratricopeptide (TPR) repeat protein
MRQTLATARQQEAPSAGAEVDPEAAEMLRALGYVARAGGQQVVAGASLRDPKDGQRLVPRLNRGMSAVRTDPATAIRELKSVLAEDPGLLVARRSLAVAYTSARQYDRAIAELRRLEKEGVLTAEDGVVLGDNLRFAGRLDEATAVLERTARENPRFAQPWISLAEVHVKKEKLGEAAAAFERALEIAPDHVEALRGLGDVAILEQAGRGRPPLRPHPRVGRATPGP